MSKNAAFKALKFVCVPTFALLLLLFFAFFSITEALNYITSSNGMAITLRIVAFLAEVILFVVMYDKYKTEETIKNAGAEGYGKRVSGESYIKNIFEDGYDHYRNDFKYYITKDPSVIVIKSTKNNS